MSSTNTIPKVLSDEKNSRSYENDSYKEKSISKNSKNIKKSKSDI
jgi:hypothetical protein